MDEKPHRAADFARGCLERALLFVGFAVTGAFVMLFGYLFLVEELRLFSARREFGYDMMFYSVVFGLACGLAAAIWPARFATTLRSPWMLAPLGVIAVVGALYLLGMAF